MMLFRYYDNNDFIVNFINVTQIPECTM